jgi:hypothetical protein
VAYSYVGRIVDLVHTQFDLQKLQSAFDLPKLHHHRQQSLVKAQPFLTLGTIGGGVIGIAAILLLSSGGVDMILLRSFDLEAELYFAFITPFSMLVGRVYMTDITLARSWMPEHQIMYKRFLASKTLNLFNTLPCGPPLVI